MTPPKTLTACSYCDDDAISDIPDLPFPVCDVHFAWLGMAKLKRSPHWRRRLRASIFFLKIVWRKWEDARLSISLAWSIARDIEEVGKP